jgi:hypothetical protein
MKIGDYVTVQQIAEQSECRWVVLTDLVAGKYGSTTAGIIRFIGDNEEAGDLTAELTLSGTRALLVCGALEPLCVGSVFVE